MLPMKSAGKVPAVMPMPKRAMPKMTMAPDMPDPADMPGGAPSAAAAGPHVTLLHIGRGRRSPLLTLVHSLLGHGLPARLPQKVSR